MVAQTVKNLPAMWEIQEPWVQLLGQEDPLEKRMQPTPILLPGEFHGQRSWAGYNSWDSQSQTRLQSRTRLCD